MILDKVKYHKKYYKSIYQKPNLSIKLKINKLESDLQSR